jgi:inhibitor of cysteine peptidase
MVQKEVRRKTTLYGTAAVLCAIVLISMVYTFGVSPTILQLSQFPAVAGMKTFSSIDELKNYLTTNAGSSNLQAPQEYWPVQSQGLHNMVTAPVPAHVVYGVNSLGDYSNTNIQVAGVDEADTVKTDGQYIYTISNAQNSGSYYYGSPQQASNNVYIVNADPQNPAVVSKIALGNDTNPDGLFLSADNSRLIVISSKYQSYSPSTSNGITIMPYIYSDVSTSLYIYDVSNKASPVLTRNFTVSGNYFDSRMIGNYLYAVTSQGAYLYDDVVTVPAVFNGAVASAASPTSIYYADMNQSNSYSFTSFYGIDVADNQQQPTNMTVLMSGASTMYVSQSNLYVTYPNWFNGTDITAIYKVKINGLQLSLDAQGSVPGTTINQYSMDEYNGNLRIATNLWQNGGGSIIFGSGGQTSQENNVYVLNQNLTAVGKLEGLANGENLHAVRFIGDRCYLVTFQRTDPLFVIDLSHPDNPKVLGELVIPGYSDYLHPYDETHLIGVGKEAVDAPQGSFAYYQGLKLSLFDVSNVNDPVQLANFTIGDRGTDSAVLNDPKAFLFDKTKGLLVIPVSLALVSDANKQQGASAYGDTVWQGAYVFSLSIEGGFTLKGTVTHLNQTLLDNQGHLINNSDYWNTQNQWITRSLYIGNTLYTISNSEVKLNSLTDLSQIAQVNLQ